MTACIASKLIAKAATASVCRAAGFSTLSHEKT